MISVEKENEVFVRIRTEDVSQDFNLKDYLSCFIPNHRFHPKVKAKIWDGKISQFDLATSRLPIGLLPDFHKFCKEFHYQYEFKFNKNELFNKITTEKVKEFSEKLLEGVTNEDKEPIALRDYQLEAVTKAIQNKRGVILNPTGSGKSLTIYVLLRILLAQNIDRKMILVVPSINLVSQMYSDFQEYGWGNLDEYCTRMCTGFTPDFDKNILITTWQSISKKSPKFFTDYEVLLIDETHNAKAMEINKIAKQCVNAEYRIGTTGTLPEEQSELYTIFGYLGRVISTVSYGKLQDMGVLSRIRIVNLLMKYPKAMVDKNKLNGGRPYNEEVKTIEEYEGRNKAFDYIFKNVKDKENILILTQHIEHKKSIIEYLEETLDEKYMIADIDGKTDAGEREQIRKRMNTAENFVLVASYGTLSTGVNIKKIHHVVFASSYKAKIKVLQSIGRGLRVHKSKDLLVLWDMVDDLTWVKRTGRLGMNHIYKHWLERLKFYTKYKFKFIEKIINI